MLKGTYWIISSMKSFDSHGIIVLEVFEVGDLMKCGLFSIV